jgi:alkyl sulfatase BDS1-like metallo-beta-lactamase superfamily hydrolase
MAGIHRERPGAEGVVPAVPGPATSIGDGLWMAKGTTNSYAIATDDGRVVLNSGLPFEGPMRRQAYDEAVPGPTRALIMTQGHADHFAGHRAIVEDGTDIVMQKNYTTWRDDIGLLQQYRSRNTSWAFPHIKEAVAAAMMSLPREEWAVTFPEPTVVFDDRLELEIGGRRIVLISTPGGETTDALVVWLPDDRTVFTGNLFGPLFGHVPNLVTIRGDRYREAPLYVASANTVLSLGAEKLVTGHFDPIEGADRIAEEVTILRDSTQWVHDRVIEGMEGGSDVLTLMRDVKLPAHFDVGEGYGKTSWNVRAIWETYAGWFHHRSTTELYATPFAAVAPDVVTAAGADALIAAAARRLTGGDAVGAIHIADLVLAAEPDNDGAKRVAADAHAVLLSEATNFWERAWLKKRLAELGGGRA